MRRAGRLTIVTNHFAQSDHTVQTLLKIQGLSEREAERVAEALKAVAGVLHVEVSAEDGMASILYDVRAAVPVLVAAVKAAGYDAQPL